jgi:hypothetical protein
VLRGELDRILSGNVSRVAAILDAYGVPRPQGVAK